MGPYYRTKSLNLIPIKKRNIVDYLVYGIILYWVVCYRYQVLQAFSFVYTDSDQTIMWEGLRNYSLGQFHEPRFYGQAYNTFLEALLAVPLYLNGKEAYTALPFVTMLMCLTPFIVISFFTFLKRSVFFGLVILSLPLFMPGEYALITSMPRGFVTGVFVAGLGCIGAFYPDKKWLFMYSAFMAVLAFTVNSNAVLVSIPCLLYLFLHNTKNKKYYLSTIIGVGLGGIIHLYFSYFYSTHPFYNLHRFSLDYSFETLKESLGNMDVYLNYNSPIFWHKGYMSLIVLLLIGLYFLKKKENAKAWPLILIPFIIVLTMGVSKVHEGVDSVFFHYSRMYLSLPIIIAFALSLFQPDFEPKIYYLWLFVPQHYYHQQVAAIEKCIEKNVRINDNNIVIVSKIEPIVKDCERLQKVCKENQVDLFVVANHFYLDPYAHGCAACVEEFPKTLKPSYERRTWRLLEDENTVYKTVMFIDMDNRIAEGQSIIHKILGTVDLYLVENNQLKTMELLDSLRIQYREFR